jgi:hypothetical protein
VMMSMLCNCCVRELLILARTWFAFGLPSKTGCDTNVEPCGSKSPLHPTQFNPGELKIPRFLKVTRSLLEERRRLGNFRKKP